MEQICKNCEYWQAASSLYPYCALKDLFTQTSAYHRCDEHGRDGQPMFTSSQFRAHQCGECAHWKTYECLNHDMRLSPRSQACRRFQPMPNDN